jgi:hypothetical protein
MTLQVLLGHIAEGPQRGERYYVPIKHTVITGMTEYGKTTAEEAMMHRLPEPEAGTPPFRALVFLTKRGEKTFQGAHTVKPFFRERFDWEYVRGLLESTMKERLKFETPWIIRICKMALTELKGRVVGPGEGLSTVRKLLGDVLQSEKLRDFDRNIYTLLAAYMDKVLPVIAQAKFEITETLELKPGINVMDLTPWYLHEEFQMLVIRSCMEQILERENDMIVGLPEAWKLLPQGRNTPVKLYFEKFVREGATNHNYLWIDAQDLGGVDKTPLRQVDVWIMGHMLEANEVARLLEQTIGAKIDASVIQTLPLGHFLVATGGKVVKVYVWPNGIDERFSQDVAKGLMNPEQVKEVLKGLRAKQEESRRFTGVQVDPKLWSETLELVLDNQKRIDALSRRGDQFEGNLETLRVEVNGLHLMADTPAPGGNATLQQVTWKVTVDPKEVYFKLTTEDDAGKVMWLAKEGFLSDWKSVTQIEKQLVNAHAWTVLNVRLYAVLDGLVAQGYLGKRRTNRVEYKLAEFVKFEGQ